MKIIHAAVTSSVYELAKTVEVDIQLGEDSWTTRIELLHNTERADHFRCHVWELELHRLTPSFPRDENNMPSHITDASILVERGIAHSRVAYPVQDIIAPSADAALDAVISDLKRFLEHVTGEQAR